MHICDIVKNSVRRTEQGENAISRQFTPSIVPSIAFIVTRLTIFILDTPLLDGDVSIETDLL